MVFKNFHLFIFSTKVHYVTILSEVFYVTDFFFFKIFYILLWVFLLGGFIQKFNKF